MKIELTEREGQKVISTLRWVMVATQLSDRDRQDLESVINKITGGIAISPEEVQIGN